MGKRIKKGTVGESSKYLSRAKALKKLQVSLKDFRRLCILKGVYPREPPKKLARTGQTYYHLKDINFIATERTLQRFRDMKVYLRKLTKAKRRGDLKRYKELKARRPKQNLQHLVRERYPTFVDALRDLDDPLCQISLVASFPAKRELGIAREVVQECLRLQREFNLYVIRSHSLKKVFVSIKGIYFQAEIQGQTVTWIQPHQLPATLPVDVDYRVMNTFLDFYRVLLKFVNFKLFSSIGLLYPPEFDAALEQNNFFSYKALREVRDDQNEPSSDFQDNKNSQYAIDEKFKNDTETSKYLTSNQSNTGDSLLFSKLVFWLSTEVPKPLLEFVILANGGQVFWLGDGEEMQPSDARITHFLSDRTPEQLTFYKGREYVQPQWIFDSLNAGLLLPIREYALGKLLPPHLSPFAQKEQLTYLPEREKQIKKLKGEDVEEEAEEGVQDDNNEIEEELEDDDSEAPKEDILQQISGKKLAMFAEDNAALGNDFDQDSYGISSSQDEEEDQQEPERKFSDEEAEEVQNTTVEEDQANEYDHEKEIEKQKKNAQKKLKEHKDSAKKLMSRKNAKLYERIMVGKEKRQEKEKLLKKKAKIIKKKKENAINEE